MPATGLVSLRQRTREIAEAFGLDRMQCTRFITDVAEIARNALQYAGAGAVSFEICTSIGVAGAAQQLCAVVEDNGPGIADIDAALHGRAGGARPAPMGIVGARKLVDALSIACPPQGGTEVGLEMGLPGSRRFSNPEIAAIALKLMPLQRPQAQDELETQNREMLLALQELRQKQIDLEEADKRKNQFLVMLAHELRNPLGTLKLNLDILDRLLARKTLDAVELAQRRDVMARQTLQMSRLVEDIMEVSRISQGKVELQRRPAEMNQLVSEALEMTDAALRNKRHEVTLDPYRGELWIDGDAARLKQVLCNLLQNSARYTPANGKISISVLREDACVVVEVADNGIGISADMLPHVFELFVQAQSAGHRGEGGLGMGLTLVQGLVQQHGGTVTANSAGPGLGSIFRVALPLVAPGGTPAEQAFLVQ